MPIAHANTAHRANRPIESSRRAKGMAITKTSKLTRTDFISHVTGRVTGAVTSRVLRSLTLRISCRGRLQNLHAAQNQDGGSGLLQRLVSRGLLPDNETDNDQRNACYQTRDGNATVHFAFCLTETKMQSLTMPQ